ncbi:MAG TPA: SusC/RagA family TonB-linked outer membrane protein [Gemmatimonadaceae bacterium]|nr:SusC/RagA family TonB-linked outer membrane protein [Gemmatimonadaceae bacterium]
MRSWILRLTITAALALASAAAASAQTTARITGSVADSVTGAPLPGAQVIVTGTKLGAVANSDGHFTIEGVPAGQAALRVQRIGYAFTVDTITAVAGQTTTVNFRLQPRAVMLKEVVAVGYGTERKEEVTSAVSSVNAEDFVQAPARDAASLIAGKIPGLAVTTPSGDPTSGTEISLRGITTLEGSRNPLILIDGIPGDLNTVPPRDIQSISVLKDASAAAIYGSRASNGVILITTKKYDGGKPTIRYDGYASLQTIAKAPDFLTAADYRSYIKQGYGFQDLGATTDWQSEVLRQPVSQRHNVSITGGSGNSSYTASLNYENTQGIFQRSDNKSLNGRIDLAQTMFDGKLETDFDLLSRVHNYFRGPDFDYAWREALIRNPTDSVHDANGDWMQRSGYFYTNPLSLIDEENGNYEGRDLRLHGTVKLRPVDHLNLSVMAGTERSEGQDGDATTFKHINTTQLGENGTASRGASNEIDHIMELTGTYANTIGRHDFTLLGGYSYQDFEYDGFSANTYGFPTDLFGYNQLQQGSALSTGQAYMSSYKNSNKLIGFFGRLNYDWDNRFLLMGSLRYEGNSRFGADHKWGMFPAVSAGWQIANEHFMDGLPWVNQLKLRVGYGVTGIAPSQSYLSLTSYSYGRKFLYDGNWVEGLSPSRNPNPDLRWERKSELNLGVDFALFSSRVSGSLDAYQSDNRDMLYNYSVPTPPYLYGNMLANVGHMQNKGLEASLSYDVVRRPDFQWTTSANWSTNRNKLVSLSNDVYQTADFFYTGYTGEPVQQSTHRVDVGGPIGNFWGWKSVDIDTSGAWIVLDSTGNRISVRDAKDKDKRVLGNGLPKDYVAWNNTLRYKHFDLNVNMRGAFDFQILNFQRMFYENPTILQYNMLKSAFDKVYGKRMLNYDLALVSYYIENGDYWKVDNVTLGFTLSPQMLGPASRLLSGARLYVSGSNLLTLTGYKGMDPEVTTLGSSDDLSPGDDTRDTYPTTRMFTFGLNLTF